MNILRHLACWHDITYLCNILPSEEPYLDEMKNLGLKMETIPWTETPRTSWRFYVDLAKNLFSSYPFNVNKDHDPRLRQRAAELLQQQDFDLLVCDFVQMARNCIGFDQIPKLLFQHNVEAQIFQRQAKRGGGPLRRLYMWLQWKKMQRFEAHAGNDFDRVVAVSDRDRETFQESYGWTHVEVIDTAVDTDYFHPLDLAPIPRRCVFVGSMDWLPNEDGVLYFVQAIWPLIRKQLPDATFSIVGRNPSHAIRALNGNHGIHVTGSVADVRPFLSESDIVVVPLRVGGGTRLKVYEAMAMRKPVVSTSIGIEGLNVTHRENVLIADDPATFAEHVVGLANDPGFRTELANNGLAMVHRSHTPVVAAKQFECACLDALGNRSISPTDDMATTSTAN
ncbi:glycosyltransferase [Stieleria maiorica]|uniref:glycosyltransferase n=1 Tax=Stieleria maiorica TaxID=2795974 RepID=UPI00142F2DCD|nr:glycosyltransferase [Stieleria maiorica]